MTILMQIKYKNKKQTSFLLFKVIYLKYADFS